VVLRYFPGRVVTSAHLWRSLLAPFFYLPPLSFSFHLLTYLFSSLCFSHLSSSSLCRPTTWGAAASRRGCQRPTQRGFPVPAADAMCGSVARRPPDAWTSGRRGLPTWGPVACTEPGAAAPVAGVWWRDAPVSVKYMFLLLFL
jgi:hypothetical protein